MTYCPRCQFSRTTHSDDAALLRCLGRLPERGETAIAFSTFRVTRIRFRVPHLPCTTNDEALDCQRFGTHRAVSMQPRRRDPDLGAKPEFAAIRKA